MYRHKNEIRDDKMDILRNSIGNKQGHNKDTEKKLEQGIQRFYVFITGMAMWIKSKSTNYYLPLFLICNCECGFWGAMYKKYAKQSKWRIVDY